MAKFPDVGDAFGSYRLVSVLGRGTQGVVFEGFDFRLSRPVAIKVFLPEAFEASGNRDWPAGQVAALAALNSLHVVQLYDHGEQDGCRFLVTQLIPEGDFGVFLAARGPLAPKVAVSVITQLCEGLIDAQAAGVALGDLGPSSVLVRDRGSVLYAHLGGFGIAARGDLADAATAYLAPERFAGAEADLPSAIYSLGCLLWVALTGAPLYPGSDLAVARAHLEAPIPQLAEDTASINGLNEILRRALAKDPGERYPAPADFAAALGELVGLPAMVTAAAAVEVAAMVEPELAVPGVDHHVPVVTTASTPGPFLFTEDVDPALAAEETPEVPKPVEEIPEALLGFRARRARKRALLAAAQPATEPEPAFEEQVGPGELIEEIARPQEAAETAGPPQDETPEALLGFRARRARKRALLAAAQPGDEVDPELDEAVPAIAPDPDPKPRRLSRRARRKENRRPRDLGWVIPGGLLLVVPILALVGVFILVNGQGGSNFGKAVTTPPQVVAVGEPFSFGAFTSDAGWSIGATGALWRVSDLVVSNVASQPEDAHFTITVKKGGSVLVALDCRTADLLPAQAQPVSCDDPTNAAFDPAWDQVTIEQAY